MSPTITYTLEDCCGPQIGGCCFYDECEEIWKCIDTTEEGCASLFGNFQGIGLMCEGNSCEDTCCRPYEAGLPNDVPSGTPCFYQTCEEGWFAAHCDNWELFHDCGTPETGPCALGSGCAIPGIGDPVRDTSNILCKAGGLYPSQVTVAGATFNTSDAGLDAVLTWLMNTTYTVPQIHCTPINFKYFPNMATYGSNQFGVVAVVSSTGGGAGQTAAINIVWEIGGMGSAAYAGLTQALPAYDTYTDCMGNFIDCNAVYQVNGAANISGGTFTPDITAATVVSEVP